MGPGQHALRELDRALPVAEVRPTRPGGVFFAVSARFLFSLLSLVCWSRAMRRRTLRLTTQSPCARYLHGERVIFPPIPQQPPTADEEVKMVMLMIDFNVHPKRMDDPVSTKPMQEGAGGKYKIVDRETVTDPEAVFQYPVVSRLPYAMSTRSGVCDLVEYTGFMIDQDQLIAMRVSPACAERTLYELSLTAASRTFNSLETMFTSTLMYIRSEF